MRQTLKKALQINFGHEGGFVNARTDRGGPTKYGITIATLSRHRGYQCTQEDVRNLTLAEAEEIYRKYFWPMTGSDQAPAGLDYALFNTGVMSGPTRAVKLLQIVLQRRGVYSGKIDGHFGPGTMQGINEYGSVPQLIEDFVMRHLEFCRGIKGAQGWAANGRGWEYRLTGKDPKGIFKDQPGVIGYALQLYKEHSEQIDNFPAPKAEKVIPQVRPVEIEQEMEAPATPAKPTVVDTLLKPESSTSLITVISTILSATSDSPPLQYAFAAVVVIAGCTAAYSFYRRIQTEEVL